MTTGWKHSVSHWWADDGLVDLALVGACPEGVQVVEQAPGLVLLDVQPGQAQQPAGVVAGVHDLRLDADHGTVGGGVDGQLGHVEPEGVEPPHPVLDAEDLPVGELLDAGELGPQLPVAGEDRLRPA